MDESEGIARFGSSPPATRRGAGRVGRPGLGTSIMLADKGGMSGIPKRSRIVRARGGRRLRWSKPRPPPRRPRPRWLKLRGWLPNHSMSVEVIRFGMRSAGRPAVKPEHSQDRHAGGLRRRPSATDELPPSVASAHRDARPEFRIVKAEPGRFLPVLPDGRSAGRCPAELTARFA